jgi:ABC-2 type transport system permease protein
MKLFLREPAAAFFTLLFPLLFLSGATVPLEVLPPKMQQYVSVLPMSHVVKLLRGMWIGESWSRHWTEVGLLTAILVIGIAISAKTFRWE